MPLIPIDLGTGRVAHIREETTIGELEDAQWLEAHWIPSQPEHSRSSRRSMCLPMIAVVRWEGMPEGFSWPDLIQPLASDQPAIEARYLSLRRHIGLKTLSTVASAINTACIPTEELAGN